MSLKWSTDGHGGLMVKPSGELNQDIENTSQQLTFTYQLLQRLGRSYKVGFVMRLWILLLLGLFSYSGALVRRRYFCPPDFLRLGNSCYYFSTHIATWHNAYFTCRDLGSKLAAMQTGWEDRNMRSYLNRPELARLERWIGGIYDWEQQQWVWAESGKALTYQGFTRRSPNEDRNWHCIFMDPTVHYRWGHRSCIEEKHYICETRLVKASTTTTPEPINNYET